MLPVLRVYCVPPRSGATEMLELELTVVDSEHAGHKIADLITVTYDEDQGPLDKTKGENFRTAVRIGLAKLRAIVESARGIRPDDNSDDAKARRRVESYREFDGITFVAQLKIQPAQNGYRARNVIDYAVIPAIRIGRRRRSRRPPPWRFRAHTKWTTKFRFDVTCHDRCARADQLQA